MRIQLSIRNYLVIFVLLFFMLWIEKPTASAQDFRTDISFWNPPQNTSQCRASFEGIGPFKLTPTLTRQPHPNDDGVNFATHYGMLLAQTIAGNNVSKTKAFLLDVASAGVYTRPNRTSGWSPIYIQSNLIRMTAMYIRVMDQRGLLSFEERKVLIAWGDRMIPGQKGSKGNGSADSQMASGVAMIAWGNIKGDRSLMKNGYRKFMVGYKFVLKNVGKLRRHSKHRSVPLSSFSLEDEYNIALMHAVEGAAILRNLGVDIASPKVGGRNLHDAVAWWTSVMVSKPAQFKGNKAWGHNWHVGWIPIYIRMFPQQPINAKLKSHAKSVTAGRSPTFRAASLGGATDCLW